VEVPVVRIAMANRVAGDPKWFDLLTSSGRVLSGAFVKGGPVGACQLLLLSRDGSR
jgi:hypothetical protein